MPVTQDLETDGDEIPGSLKVRLDEMKVPLTISGDAGAETPILFVNEAFSLLRGQFREDVAGRDLARLYGVAEQAELAQGRDAALSDRKMHRFEIYGRRTDGSAFEEMVFMQAISIRDFPGRLVSCHFPLDRTRWGDTVEFATRNFELRAINTIRLISGCATVAALLGTARRNRGARVSAAA